MQKAKEGSALVPYYWLTFDLHLNWRLVSLILLSFIKERPTRLLHERICYNAPLCHRVRRVGYHAFSG